VYIRIIKDIYEGGRTKVMTPGGVTDELAQAYIRGPR